MRSGIIGIATWLALSVGCQTTAPVLFEGQDIKYARGLTILARKDEDRIIVGSGKFGFGIPLPYAEDWTFDPSPDKPVFGSSRTADMIVTVKAGHEDKPINEETYLREELLGNLRTHLGTIGVQINHDTVRKLGDHFILEYVAEKQVEGGAFWQANWWGVRQNEQGTVCDIHLSSTCKEKPKHDKIRLAALTIIAQEFQFFK